MITSTLPRWRGDAEPGFVLDLARELNTDFDIELIAPHAPGAATQEVLQGIQVTRFRYWWPRWQAVAYQGGIAWRIRENRLRILQLPFFFGFLIWETAKRLRSKPGIDLIHAHWLIPQGWAALVARKLANQHIPMLCTSHGGDLFGLRGRVLGHFKRRVIQQSNVVTVVSQAMADRAQMLVPGVKPIVIPMGTDLRERFIPTPRPRAARSRRLIFVGRLVPKKGLEYLLEALQIVKMSGTEFSLEIVGHGPLLERLREQSRSLALCNEVSFIGPVSHESLAEHYQKAAIAVFPFIEADDGDQEGFGLVMVEAMGCGCAVIASDIPAVRDVILDQKTGMLAPPGNSAALAERIVNALADIERTDEIATAARQYAVEHFDWEITRLKFKGIYEALIRTNSPPASED